ncbi:hypothetical protein BDM02DRAFT_1036590 [Thelephora ganbajun]|uniref:Uncharacterized protein n=1 Tax=Thelephora ganbajun TaxID=370292 RepID=A0ACB6ZN43_THEGA|nr:hypothetical protein BDM02DRAFT_1036590 [Thelephora ganbajun]
MDVNKAGRVRSYVHAQLAFVPFYGTDSLGTGDTLPETFSLQTPFLTARSPLVTIQPEFNPSSTSVCLPVQGPKGVPNEANSTLTGKTAKSRKKQLGKHPNQGKERNRPLGLKSDTTTSGPDPSGEPAKELSPMKRERRRREKPRLPTGLSFLYGFVPKNVGPSRLTIPAGDKGFFGKGRSSLTAAAQRLFHREPESAVIGSRLPSTPPSKGLDCGDAMSKPQQKEGILGNHSPAWDIELEDDILPSDSSLLACDTTIVIDTGRTWNHQEGTQQSFYTAMDSFETTGFIETEGPNKYSHSSPHVASRFFSKCVSGFCFPGDTLAPHMPTPTLGDYPNQEPEVPTLDDFDCYHLNAGLDHSPNQDSFLGSCYGTCLTPLAGQGYQEMVADWSDVWSSDTSFTKAKNSEGNNPLVRGPSLGVNDETLSAWSTPEQVHCFSEGRRLLFGI